MAKGRPPPFVARGKAGSGGGGKAPPFGKKVAREAKAEGEPPGVEAKEMAMGFKRGGKKR